MTACVSKTQGQRGARARVVTASLMAALFATWGGASNSTAAPASAAASREAASPFSARYVGTTVRVTESEFSIALDRRSFRPGRYTFVIQNRGQVPHNLLINGPGAHSQASRLIAGGRAGSLTVTLRRGSYRLWCSVPGHDGAGMHTTITVR